MRRRIRWRWWGKWAATLAAVVLLGLWSASALWFSEASGSRGRLLWLLSVKGGVAAGYAYWDQSVDREIAWYAYSGPLEANRWVWWYFRAESISNTGTRETWLSFPIWLPAAPFVLLSVGLWYRDRRRSRPGACRRCGYDLSGVTGGVCPECGGASAAQTKAEEAGASSA